MNSFSAKAILGAAVVVLATLAVVGSAGVPAILAVLSAGAAAAGVRVAFSTQSRALRDDARLVYRPVYARRQSVQRPVRSDD